MLQYPLANFFHRQASGPKAIFSQHAEQEMLNLDLCRANLARLITREENRPPGFLGITLEHMRLLPRATAYAGFPITPFHFRSNSSIKFSAIASASSPGHN